MNISYNWLKQYLDINLPKEEVSAILTSIGLEVESVDDYETIKGGLEGFVVGEVKTCSKHPNADKLSVTTVDVGGPEVLPIVCGAPNVAAGQKVIVATVGTTIYKGDENFKISKAKIRGEVSEGMICAEDEIGIGTSHDGILVLDPSVKVGTPAKDYFKIESDVIFVIGLTPNRIDAASHYGVARELAAYLKQKQTVNLQRPSVDHFKIDNNNRITDVVIENEEACPRYSGVTITGVYIQPSPDWLQQRLKAIGLNPINNVVDITNFVLHEIGQPLHAFDADKITGGRVIIKTLPEGTRFKTLDNQERSLSSEDLMICNADGGMCIAGVFGGVESGITESSKNVFLESACFNPVYVRKTSKRHLLYTDASFRFERGADPNITVYALKRAAMLIKEIAGGTISSPIMDVYPKPVSNTVIDLNLQDAYDLIGKTIEVSVIKNILASLDIEVLEENATTLKLSLPPYRVDVKRPADVVEEILRIYGFNNVEISERVHSTLSYIEKPNKDTVVNTISNSLSATGFNEIMSNSLTSSLYYTNLESYKPENLVMILNPLSQELNCMRQTLLFAGLEAIRHNTNRRNPNLKLYEFGHCYIKEEAKGQVLQGFTENQHLAVFLTGLKSDESWTAKQEPTTFFTLKAQVEYIMERVGIQTNKCQTSGIRNDIFSDGLKYTLNNSDFVQFGIVNKKLAQQFDIKNPVFYADFNWDYVMKLIRNNKVTFEELPRFPEVRRDLSLVINKDVTFEKVRAVAQKSEKRLLRNINLFDVYEGDKIDSSKKAYAMSFILRDAEKTLTDQEVDGIMQKLLKAFESEVGAQIRQ
jgi:phenylalanyl-tRNA synthetase beta chain